MAVINTTNIIDSSMSLKAKLKNNMVGDNYYIENLQYKRNADWEMRNNRVCIEEELHKQCSYTKKLPEYTPIEVVIRSVKDEKGKDLGTDWAQIAFKDLYYPNNLGTRYRFDSDGDRGYKDLSKMSEEEKYYETCIWLGINRTNLSTGNSIMLRRCNANMAVQGSPTGKYKDVTEVRYEPVVLENNLKYINMYYNQTLVAPQAEWYITAQLNYFTNSVKINDRLILGGVSLKDRENNSVYKVKAITKATSNKTFSRLGSDEIENIPLIILALDKDMVDESDNFETRIASQSPMYLVPSDGQNDEGYPEEDINIVVSKPNKRRILLGEEMTQKVAFSGNLNDPEGGFKITYKLKGTTLKDAVNYMDFSKTENTFTIKNKQEYRKGNVNVKVEGIHEGQKIIQNFTYELGGFY